WVNHQPHFQNIAIPPPYVLASDDVIVIRFRARRGIDWSKRWTVETIREFCEPLRRPIVAAFGTINWRRGGEIQTDRFEMALVVEQQAEYLALVGELTEGFTTLPDIPPQRIELE